MSLQRPNIEKMHGYQPGEQLNDSDTIKLNTNENPYTPSKRVLEALSNIDGAALRRYPPPLANDFRDQAALLHQVRRENIVPTNGGDELLRLVFTTFADPGDTVLVMQPSYSLYPVLADIQNCKLQEVPLEDDWSMPANFLTTAAESIARIMFLVNPHAPTGRLLDVDYLAEVAECFKGVLVIDEAYVDFVDPENEYNAIELIQRFENVLLLRTLSKGYSLAGLRFGYGIAATSLIEPMLLKTRDSYNTDYIAQKLAVAALVSVSDARQNWDKIRKSRESLRIELKKLGIETEPSQSNFLLAKMPQSINAKKLYEALKQRLILVRYFDQPRLQDRLRITVGTPDENQQLIQQIRKIIHD